MNQQGCLAVFAAAMERAQPIIGSKPLDCVGLLGKVSGDELSPGLKGEINSPRFILYRRRNESGLPISPDSLRLECPHLLGVIGYPNRLTGLLIPADMLLDQPFLQFEPGIRH